MPKLKSHRGARKRLQVTAKKKVMHSKAYRSHILVTKPSKRKRLLGKKAVLSKADRKAAKAMLPYDF